MPQTKNQKRRKAIGLKSEAIAHWRRQIARLENLLSRSLDDAGIELLRGYDHDVNEQRRELIASHRRKIQAHERDIANTEAKLGLAA